MNVGACSDSALHWWSGTLRNICNSMKILVLVVPVMALLDHEREIGLLLESLLI